MKKGIKTLAAAALAISALTPVVASAASNVADGVYTSAEYYTLAQFKQLSTTGKSAALTSTGAVVVIGGQAYKATDVLSATDAQLPTLGTAAENYTTAAGNKLVSGQKLDTPTAPIGELKVESVSAINAQKVKVTFNKEIDATDAATHANFVISGTAADGTALSASSSALQTDKKSVVVTLNNTIKQNTVVGASVLPIKSAADSTIKTAPYSTTFTFSDTVKPTLAKTESTASGEVTLTFSEELTASTLITGNVKVYNNSGALLTGGGTDYTFAKLANNEGFKLSGLTEGETYKVEVVNVTDLAGNLTSPNFISTTITPKFTADTVAPKVTKIESVGRDTLVVHVSEELADIATTPGTDPAKYVAISGTGITVDATAAQVYDKAKGTVTVKLAATLPAEGAVSTVTVANTYKDKAGNTGAAFTETVGFTQISSVTKSEVVTRNNVDYVKVTFDREISVSAGALAGTLTNAENVQSAVTIASGKATKGTTVAENNVLYIEIPVATDAGKLEITLPTTVVTTLKEQTKVSVNYNKLAPKVVSATQGGAATDTKTLTVVFDKEMGQSALNAAAYTIDGVQVFESAIFDGDKKTVKLTTKKNAISETASFDLGVTTDVKAANGAALAQAYKGVVSLTENVAPKVLKAKISADGAKITLTFSEAVTNASADKNDYEVLVGGTKYTAVTTAAGTSTSVVLTLDTAIDLAALNSTITLNTLSTTDIVDGAANKAAVTTAIPVER